MTLRQVVLPVVLSFVAGGLSGAGASRIITEHRLTALEVKVDFLVEGMTRLIDHMEKE